jgi:hypothetical protein
VRDNGGRLQAPKELLLLEDDEFSPLQNGLESAIDEKWFDEGTPVAALRKLGVRKQMNETEIEMVAGNLDSRTTAHLFAKLVASFGNGGQGTRSAADGDSIVSTINNLSWLPEIGHPENNPSLIAPNKEGERLVGVCISPEAWELSAAFGVHLQGVVDLPRDIAEALVKREMVSPFDEFVFLNQDLAWLEDASKDERKHFVERFWIWVCSQENTDALWTSDRKVLPVRSPCGANVDYVKLARHACVVAGENANSFTRALSRCGVRIFCGEHRLAEQCCQRGIMQPSTATGILAAICASSEHNSFIDLHTKLISDQEKGEWIRLRDRLANLDAGALMECEAEKLRRLPMFQCFGFKDGDSLHAIQQENGTHRSLYILSDDIPPKTEVEIRAELSSLMTDLNPHMGTTILYCKDVKVQKLCAALMGTQAETAELMVTIQQILN